MDIKWRSRPLTVLVADDDADDRLLIADAFLESRLRVELRFVCDGEELMDYLWRRGRHADAQADPFPDLILLDLNMPRKDGREALAEIKRAPELQHVPVVILTTSSADEDVARSYALGGNSYVTKPVSFTALVELVRTLGNYWFQCVELPSRARREEARLGQQ